MRMFADMPTNLHNWLCFADRSLEASTFTFAVKGVGTQDQNMGGGRRLWCSRDHRRVAVSRHSSTSYRRLTLLEERLPGPELNEVPGLLSLVKEQNWAEYNSVRVGDLLHNMVSLQKHLRSKLDEAERCLWKEKSDQDKTYKSMVAAEDDLKHRKGQLDHMWYDLNAAREELHKLHRQLNDAHREIDYLRSINHGSRSAPTQSVRTAPTTDVENRSAQDGDGTRSPEYFPDARSGHSRHEPAPARKPISGEGTKLSSRSLTAPIRPVLVPSGKTDTLFKRLQSGLAKRGQISATTTENNGSAANITSISQGSNAESFAEQRKRLRKSREGYPFFEMPKKKNKQSAQTTDADNISKANGDENGKQAATARENDTSSSVVDN